MATVMAFGTFDIIHPGHIFFLTQSKDLGSKLVVVVAKDSTIKQVKGRAPKYGEAQRVQHLKDLRIADEIRVGYEDDKYKVIEEVKPDIITLGYDQDSFSKNLEEEMKKRGLHPSIVRMSAYKAEKYKSSKLR